MQRNSHLRIALSGAVWFSLLAGVALPLLMTALPKPLGPNDLSDVGSHLRFALLFFGLPAGVVGLAFANRNAHSQASLRVFCLGAALVLITNLLAGLGVSLLGSHFASVGSLLEQAILIATGFLLLDVLLFKGAPFLFGGLAALAFRAGIRRVGWAENEF
jgi:hypothetical protein